MRSHLDLDLMATPLWVPVKLSAAREGERFERVIAFNANFHFLKPTNNVRRSSQNLTRAMSYTKLEMMGGS